MNKNILINFSPLIGVFIFSLIVSACSVMPSIPLTDKNWGIKENTNILVYCAGGYRSALAGKTLIELGFPNVFNIGGFDEWINSGGEIQPYL